MKTLFATIVFLMFMVTPAETSGEFCSGYKAGYKAGFCEGQIYCVGGKVYTCPFSMPDATYMEGWMMGYKRGMSENPSN